MQGRMQIYCNEFPEFKFYNSFKKQQIFEATWMKMTGVGCHFAIAPFH